jgi:hypothetical protein
MIQRFSLYGEPAVWKDNIQADPNGRWVNWNAVEPYIRYCRDQGVNFETPTPEPVHPVYTEDDFLRDYDPMDDIEEDEDDLDTFEFMERQRAKDDNL